VISERENREEAIEHFYKLPRTEPHDFLIFQVAFFGLSILSAGFFFFFLNSILLY